MLTDLALEATEYLRGEMRRDIPGVRVQTSGTDDITVTHVNVFDEVGAQHMGKPCGNYITLEAPGLRRRDWHLQQQVGDAMLDVLGTMPVLSKTNRHFLIVGLGNRHASADSLGPRVVGHALVTRHLKPFVPKDIQGRLRAVSAIAPGVLGITGIETGEIVKGIVEKIQPDAVIAIDALCARATSRITTTIQIADTGVHPGSGVGNNRLGLTRETLGVPVLAIGIPTVVRALTIVIDALKQNTHQEPGAVTVEDETMEETLQSLMVTPKEIDTYIEDMARVIASALNQALHPEVDITEFTRFLG